MSNLIKPKQIEFIIPGDPKGQPRPKFDPRSCRAYYPEWVYDYRDAVAAAYCEAAGDYMFNPDKGLELEVYAFLECPKSWSKKKRLEKVRSFDGATSRPDIDNIIKLVMDGLNGVAYRDDAQVTTISAWKTYYEAEPRVQVKISEIINTFEGSGL